MAQLTHFTTFDDAYYYFFQAKGTPDTVQGSTVRQRHLRTAVLLGWVAVDDALAAFVRKTHLVWPPECKSRALIPRVKFICKGIPGAELDTTEFSRHRNVRNAIAHPKGNEDVAPSIEEVDAALAYCKKLIRIMFPHLVVAEEVKGRLSGLVRESPTGV